VVADVDLGALGQTVAMLVEAGVHRGLLAAAADRLDLHDVVGPAAKKS
jgi:hypothetical protein